MMTNPNLSPQDCLEFMNHTALCSGRVEFRMSLSGSRNYPRCGAHWSARLAREEETRRRYPVLQPAGFDPADAGERWDDD